MDTTKVTFTTVYNDFKDAINGMAESLKVGAEHVYEVLVRQQIVSATTYLLIDLFFLLLAIICVYTFKTYEKKEGEYVWNTGYVMYLAGGIIFSIILTVLICKNTGTIVTGFLNPEYGAMKDIANFIR